MEAAMDFIKEDNQIYLKDEKGQVLAEIAFPETAPGEVTIIHTFVDKSLRGQQIASKLTEAVCDVARCQGKKIRPMCTYAEKWFKENPDMSDVLVK